MFYSSIKFIINNIKNCCDDLQFYFSWSPRKAHHERYTLLRSIHVHKRCRVQYEVRTWFRFIHFHKLTGSTAETFLEYVQRNLPEGVALKVTKVSYFHLS